MQTNLNVKVASIPVGEIAVLSYEDGLPLNPRGPVHNTTDLQSSIREVGILNPLSVRESEGGYELIDGHRRLTAARALGLSEVPCVVHSGEQDALDLMLAANVQQKYPEVVLNKDGEIIGGVARAVAVKLNSGSRTLQSIGELMGISPDIVSAYQRLHLAPVNVRKAVASGRMSISAFSRIKHAPADLQEEIADGEGDVTIAKVRKAVKDAAEKASPTLPGLDEPVDVVEVLNEVKAKLVLAKKGGIGPREQFLWDEIKEMVNE